MMQCTKKYDARDINKLQNILFNQPSVHRQIRQLGERNIFHHAVAYAKYKSSEQDEADVQALEVLIDHEVSYCAQNQGTSKINIIITFVFSKCSNLGSSPLYNMPSTDGKTPQPVFTVGSLEAMELFLCPKLPGLDLFKIDDQMPLLHFCVTSVRTSTKGEPETWYLRSLVSKNVLHSLASQVNQRWSKAPDEPALTPGTHPYQS